MITTEKTHQWGTAGDPLAHVNYNIYNASAIECQRNAWMFIKNAMKNVPDSPWTCVASCDSVNYPAGAYDGVDHWDLNSDLVWGEIIGGGPKSWIILEQAGLGGAQVMFALEPSSYDTYYWQAEIRFSPGATFYGGDNYTLPASTDACTPLNNNNWWNNSGSAYIGYLTVSVSTDGQCTRIVGCSNGTTNLFMMFDKARLPEAGWPNPVVGLHDHDEGRNADCCTYATLNDSDIALSRQSGNVFAALYMGTIGMIGACQGEYIGGINTQLNEWETYPIWLCSVTSLVRGTKGMLYDIWFGTASPSIGTGDVYPPGGPYTHAMFGNIVLPWPDVVPLVS